MKKTNPNQKMENKLQKIYEAKIRERRKGVGARFRTITFEAKLNPVVANEEKCHGKVEPWRQEEGA